MFLCISLNALNRNPSYILFEHKWPQAYYLPGIPISVVKSFVHGADFLPKVLVTTGLGMWNDWESQST